jgi:hypothetical protein
MLTPFKHMIRVNHLQHLLLLSMIALTVAATSVSAQPPQAQVLARGGGKTIIQGGTGAPGFVPVITTIAFHAERQGQAVSGDFECLALVPAMATGNGSGQFTVVSPTGSSITKI